MYMLALIVHVVVCFLMIGAILLQSGKGAEIGAAFGGSSQTVFGSRGPGTFLSKVTVAAAIIFMVTSMGLAILSKQRTTASTIMDLEPTEASAPPASTTETTPAESPATESAPAEPSVPATDPTGK